MALPKWYGGYGGMVSHVAMAVTDGAKYAGRVTGDCDVPCPEPGYHPTP